MWPSGFALDSFRRFSRVAAALVQSLWRCLRSLVGLMKREKNPFLAALLQENPLLWEKPALSLVLIGIGRYFLLFSLYRSAGDFCLGKTRLGKNL